MTAITLNLSDHLVDEAKQAGVYNEMLLTQTLNEFLKTQLSNKQKPKSEVYDFIMNLPKANYADDGLVIQQKLRDEW